MELYNLNAQLQKILNRVLIWNYIVCRGPKSSIDLLFFSLLIRYSKLMYSSTPHISNQQQMGTTLDYTLMIILYKSSAKWAKIKMHWNKWEHKGHTDLFWQSSFALSVIAAADFFRLASTIVCISLAPVIININQ